MLITSLRLFFVVAAALIGFLKGINYYSTTTPWLGGVFGGLLGLCVALTLITAEHAFRRKFTRSLVAFLVGLAAGLLLSLLELLVLKQALQDGELYRNVDMPLALVTTYLVLITVLRGADRFRLVVPFVEFRSDRVETGALVVDPGALADARLVAMVRAGLISQRLLLPRAGLAHCEALVAGEDAAAQARGRRALENLAELRALGDPTVEIDETEIPNASGLNDVLIRLARLEGGRLVAGDAELVRLARAEGVGVIDLQGLVAAFAPQVRPGEVLSVRIDKAGEAKGQGVGFLDDGSMVIVADGALHVGSRVRCTVLRLHTTASGRMVFAEPVK